MVSSGFRHDGLLENGRTSSGRFQPANGARTPGEWYADRVSADGNGRTARACCSGHLLAALALATGVAVTNATTQSLPVVSLLLSPAGPATIRENGGVVTVTATLDRAAETTVSMTITVEPAGSPSEPVTEEDYVVSANRVLTFTPGSTSSRGTVTVTAVDNAADGATHKRVRVGGRATTSNAGFAGFREFLIRDDEDPPGARVVLTPPSIAENGGVSTVTAALEHPARGPVELLVQVRSSAAGDDAAAAGYTLSPNKLLTIAQGSTSSAGTVTITAMDNDDDAPPGARRTLHVRGYRQAGVTSALVTPWQALQIVDDERATPAPAPGGARPAPGYRLASNTAAIETGADYRTGPDASVRSSAARFPAVSWSGSSRSACSTVARVVVRFRRRAAPAAALPARHPPRCRGRGQRPGRMPGGDARRS